MTDRRPTLCVVAGPNGSGKTTTTIQLLNNEWAADSIYINPNNIAQETFGDWNSPEAVLKAAEEATRMRYRCLEQGHDFVFETVFSSHEKLEFLHKAKDAGFFIRLFYVCTSDPAINVARITQRYMNGGMRFLFPKSSLVITNHLLMPRKPFPLWIVHTFMTIPSTINFLLYSTALPTANCSSNTPTIFPNGL